MAAEAASAWVVSRFIANATGICKLRGTGELAESPPLQSTLQLLALTLLTDGAPDRLEAACEARSFVTVYIGVPLRTTYLLRLPHEPRAFRAAKLRDHRSARDPLRCKFCVNSRYSLVARYPQTHPGSSLSTYIHKSQHGLSRLLC